MKRRDPGEELGVLLRVDNAIAIDIKAHPHSSKGIRGLTEPTSFRLGPLAYILPSKPHVQLWIF